MRFLAPLLATLLLSGFAQASPRVCVESVTRGWQDQRGQILWYRTNDFQNAFWEPPRCESLRRIQNGGKVLQITLGISSVGLMCSGVGLPVTAVVQGAVLGIEIIKFVVDQIPCEDVEKDRKLRAEIKKSVCMELKSAGYQCAPTP